MLVPEIDKLNDEGGISVDIQVTIGLKWYKYLVYNLGKGKPANDRISKDMFSIVIGRPPSILKKFPSSIGSNIP